MLTKFTVPIFLALAVTSASSTSMEDILGFIQSNPSTVIIYSRGILDGAIVYDQLTSKRLCPPSEFSSTDLATHIVTGLVGKTPDTIPSKLQQYQYEQLLVARLLTSIPCGKAI
jgi:hypothetical protein